jgi:hypothetical protein
MLELFASGVDLRDACGHMLALKKEGWLYGIIEKNQMVIDGYTRIMASRT